MKKKSGFLKVFKVHLRKHWYNAVKNQAKESAYYV